MTSRRPHPVRVLQDAPVGRGRSAGYRTVIASIYHMVPDVPGTEKLQAELELEAARLGVIKPGGRDVH